MQKAEIRRFVSSRRLALSGEESREKSLVIQRSFLNSSLYRNAGVIALYSSFKGEVRTDLVIKTALEEGKHVVMPKINMADSSMHFISISKPEDLKINSFGFKEPSKGDICKPGDIDLFVVPGVAYDLHGSRLGMGKGFYDRALSSVERTRIVALAYEFQVVDKVPALDHDVSVGQVVTEKRMINPGNI